MNMNIGERIRNLRQLSSLTQEELAERAGLTKGFISQVERDRTSICLDNLVQILDALDENISDFFSDIEEKGIVYRREDRVEIEKKGISRFELLIPGSTNKKMEAVMVTLKPGEGTEIEEPHEGEEMGFVLRGRIEIQLGKMTHRAKKGECFYFAAERDHSLSNIGPRDAVLLWITSPPYF
jgi:transcriptional regulator with XRE-family HTH domain